MAKDIARMPEPARDLLPKGSAVLCAVSGGADSVCLLHLLSRREDITLTAAHFNHQLRGADSDADEAFVRALCARWGVPLTVGRGDVEGFAKREGLSMEEAARILRYGFLQTAAQAEGCGLIATAHTADDNAETMLLNLLRGTGLSGLTGIPPRRENIIRPLLSFTRQDILAYLDEHGLSHREDLSNSDETYARNKLRRRVMPLLRELNPRAAEHMLQTARQLRALDSAQEEEARERISSAQAENGQVSLPAQSLEAAPAPLRGRMLLLLLDKLGVGRKDFGAAHLNAILTLKPGGRLHLPHGVAALRQKGSLILTLRPPLPEEAPLIPGKALRWGGYTITLLPPGQAGEGSPLALSVPEGTALTVGSCPMTRRLTLPGAKGARTVKRLCADLHVHPALRDGLPAIYAGGALAAVWQLGVDMGFQPAGETCRFIQIIKTDRGERQHEHER